MAQKITKGDFNWNGIVTEQQAKDIMLAVYKTLVTYRGGEFVMTQEVDTSLNAIAKLMTQPPKKKIGILFSGICGNGKTTMIKTIKETYNYLYSVKMIENYGEFFICSAKEFAIKSHDYNWFDNTANKKYLGLDDIGEEATEIQVYGNIINPIVDLIEYRYNKMLPTFMTSNLTAPEISNKYGVRVADRLKECMDIVYFKNDSFRKTE